MSVLTSGFSWKNSGVTLVGSRVQRWGSSRIYTDIHIRTMQMEGRPTALWTETLWVRLPLFPFNKDTAFKSGLWICSWALFCVGLEKLRQFHLSVIKSGRDPALLLKWPRLFCKALAPWSWWLQLKTAWIWSLGGTWSLIREWTRGRFFCVNLSLDTILSPTHDWDSQAMLLIYLFPLLMFYGCPGSEHRAI